MADGTRLVGALHSGGAGWGVVIVAGAPQGRFGAGRLFVALGSAFAAAGHPVLRFDRRGTGDSDGDDPGFTRIGADLAAVRAAFVERAPGVRRVLGLGLCDGATALALTPGFDALALLNPWTLDSTRAADVPQAAAVAAHYRARLTAPGLARRLLSASPARLARGLARLARGDPPQAAAAALARALGSFDGPLLTVLAEQDGTAQAFAARWRSRAFSAARARHSAPVLLNGATHTFPGDADRLSRVVTMFLAGLPE